MHKRLVRREIPGGVRFVTFSCQRRLPLLRPGAVARLLVDRLGEVRASSGAKVYAYVVMPEHVHVLVLPGAAPLDRGLLSLKHSVARRVLHRWRELDAPILARLEVASGHRFWQKGGGFDRNVRNEAELSKAVRYIHDNPVKRGLAARADEYAHSSCAWWLARHRGERGPSGPGVIECDELPGGIDWRSWRGFMAWGDGRGRIDAKDEPGRDDGTGM